MTFSFSKLIAAMGLAAGSVILGISSANAQSFGFKFESTYSQNSAPKGDIYLESVKIGDEIIDAFSYVNFANIVHNDPYSGGNSGAASADTGDNATGGVRVEDATAADIVTNLSTNNLNHIIDTEDKGTFVIDLKFGKAIDNLLIWERGMNSKIGIQAVDAAGSLIGTRRVIDQSMWFSTGLSIDTNEIGQAQKLGALGVNIFKDLGVDKGQIDTIRFFAEGKAFNGPDWKFVGTDASRSLDPEDVPEPTTLAALGVFAGVLMLKKRAQTA